MKPHSDVNELFSNKTTIVKVAAPMVRYSKLQFRTLVRKYGCDLCFTPMIIADSFVKSLKARENEFTTNNDDTPVCVQFAANNSADFIAAAKLVAPFSDGADLNCGCPQRWAMKEGFGCDLLKNPQRIRDSVLELRNSIPKPFAVSVKIRLQPEIRDTIELCRSLEACGVSFISVHARTPTQRCEPINLNGLREVKQSVSVPIIANGDVRSLDDALTLQTMTNCDGVMAARGLLQNPALFSGLDRTPVSCIKDWITLAVESEMNFQCFHHHLVFMLEKVLPKSERLKFNAMKTRLSVMEYLSDYFNISLPSRNDFQNFKSDITYHDVNTDAGSYFLSKMLETTPTLQFEDYLDDSCCIFNE